MDEKEILRMIDETAAWQREADSEHLRLLGHRMTSDLRRWQQRRTIAWRVAASAAVVLIAGAYYLLLPQRVDDRKVICNQRGEEQLVVNRACSAIGNCSNPLVSSTLNGGGTDLKDK